MGELAIEAGEIGRTSAEVGALTRRTVAIVKARTGVAQVGLNLTVSATKAGSALALKSAGRSLVAGAAVEAGDERAVVDGQFALVTLVTRLAVAVGEGRRELLAGAVGCAVAVVDGA